MVGGWGHRSPTTTAVSDPRFWTAVMVEDEDEVVAPTLVRSTSPRAVI